MKKQSNEKNKGGEVIALQAKQWKAMMYIFQQVVTVVSSLSKCLDCSMEYPFIVFDIY